MKPKRAENPLYGALDFISSMPEILKGEHRKDVFNDKLENITIDTCFPTDTHIWETGIKREKIEGKWVIVEQYEDKTHAEKGHKKWVKLMNKRQDFPLKDINMWNFSEE